MERVIQDSDDELEDEGLEPCPAEVRHATDACADAGTGSTESLKKAFQAAHDAQFQTQLDGTKGNVQPAETVHILTSPSKQSPLRRLKTTPNASFTNRSDENHTTNGRSKSICNSSLIEPVHGDHEWARDAGSINNIWGLEGTIRENYTHHEPTAQFPEPSSTVMNTTLTQERLLEEVLAPGFLGVEAQPDPEPMENPYEPKKSSIPWSDFLKTPSDAAPSRPDQESWLAQTASQSRLVSQKVLPEGCVSSAPEHAADSRPQTSMPPSRSHDAPSGSLEGQTMDEPVNQSHSDALSSDAHHPRTKRKRTPHPATTDDELEAVGFPQEQYKPRPSRSRSSKASLLEPTDYSMRLEAVSKKRARRSKTMGALNEAASLATPEKIHQICEMGFTPQSTQRALEQTGGDVRESIDWLVARSGDVDELALPDPPKVKRRRNLEGRDSGPVEETVQAATGNDLFQTTTAQGNPEGSVQAGINTGAEALLRPEVTPTSAVALLVSKSPAKVEVVIPRAAKQMPATEPDAIVAAEANASGELNTSSRPEHRKPSTDMPRSDQGKQHQKVSEPAKEQKRGRGRPRKTAITTTTAAAVEHTPDKENIHDEPPPIAAEEKPLKQVIPPITAENGVEDQISEVNEAPVLPAKTPEKQTKPANSAHSPVSKGKVAYRVGLSKRARIAPLLRIVKK